MTTFFCACLEGHMWILSAFFVGLLLVHGSTFGWPLTVAIVVASFTTVYAAAELRQTRLRILKIVREVERFQNEKKDD